MAAVDFVYGYVGVERIDVDDGPAAQVTLPNTVQPSGLSPRQSLRRGMLSRMPEPMSVEMENLLQTLRAEGAGRITALAAIRSRSGCGVVEAQAVLDAHPSWVAPQAVRRDDLPPDQWDPVELLLYAMEYLDMYILFRFGDAPLPDLAIGYLETTLECVEDALTSLAARATSSGLG